jgi:SAM-dependent methyltransferase
VLIENLVSHLRAMFPEAPAWLEYHVAEAEAQVEYADADKHRRAFIDNLVGYTSIEYEHDLRKRSVYDTGFGQVHQHIAGLLNSGSPCGSLIGILSDTVDWRVYRVAHVEGEVGKLSPNDISLEEIDRLELQDDGPSEAERLRDLLQKHLGREGARPLTAGTVAFDLGFGSDFGATQLAALGTVVDAALTDRPDYADVIRGLWTEFVAYLSNDTATGFDQAMYISELYVITLAKLLCANVVSRRALHSTDDELRTILDGDFFRVRGLDNLVEYDYFGWLNSAPYVEAVLPIARDAQRTLRTYDFDHPAAHDLFGQLMAQLATRTQRLLLGQEWTPPWLAKRLARRLLDGLPADEPPRFIDMCCGSGSMLTEVVKQAAAKLPPGTSGEAAAAELQQVATGFDIDPLAVILAKVNWVVAARDHLPALDGATRISIPVYHADSMFAKTPISAVSGSGEGELYALGLHDEAIDLPSFLISPQRQAVFDAVVDVSHRVAMKVADEDEARSVPDDLVEAVLKEAEVHAEPPLSEEERSATAALIGQLIGALARLQRSRLNGIWAFILRNSYRPGLLSGRFNGLISNPPWLAMSKLADNPYQKALQRDAREYGITPPGAAHLHTELATTFLLHAVDHYLQADALVGCVLPDTVRNGYHHEPFRRGGYQTATRPVELAVKELWIVDSGTFKNEAMVLIGEKTTGTMPKQFPGAFVAEDAEEALTFDVVRLAERRTAWTDEPGEYAGWFDEMPFRQGADVMPRAAIFHEVLPSRTGYVHVQPIDRAASPRSYLVKEGKKLTRFRITPSALPDKYRFDVLLSRHLAPFEIAAPADALLPIERGANGSWKPVSPTKLAVSRPAQKAFDEVLAALGRPGKPLTVAEYFDLLDYRRKLSTQKLPQSGWLVCYGAGGGVTAAAYLSLGLVNPKRLILDQTLYWHVVDTEDEAIYIASLFNSDAMDGLIKDFQARGAFGERHIHTLPPKVTPAYDVSQALHTEVVTAGRNLLADLAAVRGNANVAEYFDPGRSLAWRRRGIRESVLPELASFDAYEQACAALYGV